MRLISVSKYQDCCAELVREAIRVPRMYYRSLRELESAIFGHQFAFQQLGAITRDQSFNSCFREWVYCTTDVSCSGGWALAIETLASNRRDDPEALFGELAERFLSQWADSEATNGAPEQ